MTKQAKAQEGLKWYRVKQLSYIGDKLCQADTFVQYEGEAGDNLEEVTEEEAKKGVQQ